MQPDDFVVTFENRKYRYDVAAVQAAVSAARSVDPGRGVILVLQRRGLPLRTITVPAGTEVSSSSVNTDAAWGTLSGSSRSNRSFGRVDLAAFPELFYELGNFAQPLRVQLNLIPELTTSPWRGSNVLAQVVIPVYTDFEFAGDLTIDTSVRPSRLNFNQTLRLPKNTFVSLTGGLFRPNRYGIDLEARTFLAGGIVAFGGRVGYTGLAVWDDWRWFYTSLNTWTGAVTIDLAVPRYALRLRASGERYLQEDLGFGLSIERAFGEIRLGFFGIISQDRNNAGFTAAIPLFPGRYSRPKWARIRPANEFNLSFWYRNLPSTVSGRDLLRYWTGQELDFLWNGVYPGLYDSHAKRITGSR